MIKQDELETSSKADDGIDWSDVFQRLVGYGIRKKRLSPETAKEVAQEAIRQYLDPEYADWERANYPTLLKFLGSRVNGIVSDMRQRKGYAAERLTKAGVAPDRPADGPNAEVRMVSADYARKAVGRLLELVEDDDLAQRIVLSELEGNATAMEQAQALGVPVTDVYRARERLAGHRRAIAKAMEEG